MKPTSQDPSKPSAPILPRIIITAADDGGLGHFDLIADPYARVAMVLGPLSLDEVGPGDTLRVYMTVKGQPRQIASYVIKSADLPGGGQVSPIFTVEANASEINKEPDGTYPFSYDVLYSNQGSDSSIEPLIVRIKRTIPGSPAQPSDPVNDLLPAPVVQPDPVSESDTSATVTVSPWSNMSEGDLVTVHWERLRVTSAPIVAGDVGQPVLVMLTAEQLREVGGMEDLPVAYEIFDVVGNHSGRSPYTFVDVEIEPPDALTAPRVREAVGGAIDPVRQGEVPFTIQIPSIGRLRAREERNIAPGDRITATFEGRIPGTGASHRWVSPPLTVPGTIFDLTIALPVDEVTPLAGGTARVAYRVSPVGGGTEMPSRHLGLAVVGVPARLPPVSIPEDANGDNVLDPSTEVADGATAVVDYANMALDDYITLDLTGRRANGMVDNDRKYRQVSHLGPQSLAIGTDYLTRLDGGTLELKYSADSYDGVAGTRAVRESESRTVSIGSGPEEPKLPAPTVSGVADGFMPPSTRQSEVAVSRSVLQIGDGVDYTWHSAVSDGAHLTVRNLNDDLRFDVAGALIKANEGSDVTVDYTRIRAGKVAHSEETRFTVGEPARLPAPTVKEAVGDHLDPIVVADAGGATVAIPADLRPGDDIVVNFGTWRSSPVQWSAGMTVIVPPGEVARRLGATLDVSYTVNAMATSSALALAIGSFNENDPRLPLPLIREADGATLDLRLFDGDATIAVVPWPLIAQGQRVWLDAAGTRADGTKDRIAVLEASVLTSDDVGKGLEATLGRAWLDTLAENSTLTLTLSTAFDGSTDHAHAVAFPPAVYTLRPGAADDDGRAFLIETFEMPLLSSIGLGRKFSFPYVDIEADVREANGVVQRDMKSPPYLTGKVLNKLDDGL
ncbi:MAG: hypothetical protein ABWX83_01285, partial [Luteibacter sp.]